MENKRLTREEIKQKYPNEYVGVVGIQKDASGVETAIVKCSTKDTSYEAIAEMALITKEIELMYYTTAD